MAEWFQNVDFVIGDHKPMIYKLSPKWEEKLQQALRRVKLLEDYGFIRELADDERASVAFALRDLVVEALTDKFAMKAAMLALAKLYHISVADIVLEKITQDTRDAIHALTPAIGISPNQLRPAPCSREDCQQSAQVSCGHCLLFFCPSHLVQHQIDLGLLIEHKESTR